MFWNLGGRMEREAGLHDWLATLKHRKVLFSMNEVGYSRRTARRPNSRLFKESGRCTVPSHSKAHWRRERTLQETSFCPASFAGFLCLSCTRTRGDLPENVSARFSYQLIEEGGGGGQSPGPVTSHFSAEGSCNTLEWWQQTLKILDPDNLKRSSHVTNMP